MRHRSREPMPMRIDELRLVQTGALRAPTLAGVERLHVVDQLAARERGVAVPLDVAQAMVEVHGSRPSVQTEAIPVPQLEREDVRRRTDLEDHPVATTAEHRAGRDQEVVV